MNEFMRKPGRPSREELERRQREDAPEKPEYQPMETAPKDRPIVLAPHNIVAQWHITRGYFNGAWRVTRYWADWLTRRKVGFEPTGWKERA